MRSLPKWTASLLVLALAGPLAPMAPASGESVERGKWYRNCANYGLTDKCIESIEYFDEKSQTWAKAIAEKNPLFHDGDITDEDRRLYASGENYYSTKCGYGQQLNLDTCYRVPGASPDGIEQIIQSVVYGESEGLKMSFEATTSSETFTRARYGDTLYMIRENSLWRMTVISDLFAQDAGIAYAQMKDPTLDVFKGSDGHWRIQASGRIQSIYTIEAWLPEQPTCEKALKAKNDYQANEVRRPFSINVGRYIYEYEKLKGSPPAGVFITNNGGCFSSLTFDTKMRIISVATGGPHFDTNGKVIQGWVEASIRGDVVRKAFNADPKTMNQAIIEVSYADGTSQNATSTTKYIAATDKVEIRAYGFTYSQPTVRVKLQPLKTANGAPIKQIAPKANVKCVKGSTTKSFVGKCPAGWRKK